ncbi:metal tolerance 11 isoform X1 [Olea europaea subsp. europaea]|uniref:Metal tolerance 11 isoform X1 n=1 Tax=Olea europaea subsp. europaea TaxID=158383 RepID=A0A8S0RU27_OLEEU|nr:metal tolerance 11 isoform X1 [Olea europaea subsp. europaea]
MVQPENTDGSEEQLLLPETRNGDCSWRLNFDGFHLSPEHKEKPPSGLHDYLGVLGPEDNVAEYYQQQVEMLEGFNEMDVLAEQGCVPRVSKEDREKLVRSETIAIRMSNVANMLLFAAKVYASIRSGSLAIVASTLDSLLDLLSGFILWFTAFSMQTPNPYRYPIGKKRMQPLIISATTYTVFSVNLNLQVLIKSSPSLVYLKWTSNYFYLQLCPSSCDLALTLLLFPDPYLKMFSSVLALYTIRTWSLTVLENVSSLIGRSAAPEYLQKLTYLCWNHHKSIRHIDTVRAYTFGSHYFVEVDIVLPADMPLQEAHDIGESLQEKLEFLPEIERAFVHLDYEYSHKPEHAQAHL